MLKTLDPIQFYHLSIPVYYTETNDIDRFNFIWKPKETAYKGYYVNDLLYPEVLSEDEQEIYPKCVLVGVDKLDIDSELYETIFKELEIVYDKKNKFSCVRKLRIKNLNL